MFGASFVKNTQCLSVVCLGRRRDVYQTKSRWQGCRSVAVLVHHRLCGGEASVAPRAEPGRTGRAFRHSHSLLAYCSWHNVYSGMVSYSYFHLLRQLLHTYLEGELARLRGLPMARAESGHISLANRSVRGAAVRVAEAA